MPVFRFVKDLFTRKEDEPAGVEIVFEDLPRVFDEEDHTIKDRVAPAIEAPAQEVRQAVAVLGDVLLSLAKADWDRATHPKLEQISRTTLPAFVRAMESCLARPLAEDPHEFYGTTTSLLKCAISAHRGQGRYLQAVLPDEMKTIKGEIDVIGHAVNRMTGVFGEEKRALEALGKLRLQYERIEALESERADAAHRADEAETVLTALYAERDETEAELAELERSPDAIQHAHQQAEVDRLRATAEALDTAHRGQTQGLAQLVKRAERLVARRGERATATRLHRLVGLLDRPLPVDESMLVPLLADGLAVVRELAGAGEISPKEEDLLSGNPPEAIERLVSRSREYQEVVTEAGAIEHRLTTSPFAATHERLTGKLKHLEHRAGMLSEERAGLLRVAEQKRTERSALMDQTSEDMETVFGKRYRLRSAEP
jgi:hypothetical protein